MRTLNKVTLIGRLGRDPEMKYTPSSKAVTTFSLATNRRMKVGDEWKEETDWHNCVVWDQPAEFANEHLRKGSLVYVEGRLQTRQWEKDGVKQQRTEVVISEFILLDSKPTERPAPARGGVDDDGDLDIPF